MKKEAKAREQMEKFIQEAVNAIVHAGQREFDTHGGAALDPRNVAAVCAAAVRTLRYERKWVPENMFSPKKLPSGFTADPAKTKYFLHVKGGGEPKLVNEREYFDHISRTGLGEYFIARRVFEKRNENGKHET